MKKIKIIEITKQKSKLKVSFNNSTSLTIDPIIKDEYNLYVGKEIEEKLYFEIKRANEIEELFAIGLKRSVVKDYSPNKLREFLLKKNKNKTVVDQVIKKMQKYQLLNEDEIIQNVIEFCNAKHYGYNRIINMLKDREISKDKINKLNYDESRELKEATKQRENLIRRYKRKNTANLKRNIYSALIRYGFEENIASLEASKVSNSHVNELNMLKLEYSKLVSSYSRKVKGKELTNKITKALLSKGYRLNDIKYVLKEETIYEMD